MSVISERGASPARKLLIVTHHFPPSAASGAFRILSFARHLPEFGWSVSVVAPPTLPWEPSDPALASQIPEATAVTYEPYREAPITKPLRKYFPYAFWIMSRARGILRAFDANKPDVLMTSGPPHVVHFAGAALARARKVRWVADFRDPWATGDAGLVKHARVQKLLERYVIGAADRIIWNTPGVLSYMRNAFPAQADSMWCVPNGYDPDAFPRPERARRVGEPIRMLHTGMIYFGRDPRPVLDALQSLEHEDCAVYTSFLGFKPGFTHDIEAEARGRGIEARVSVEGYVPHEIALRRMVEADILLLLDSPGRTLGVPAKLYEYIGAGRPILALCEQASDTALILSRSGAQHRVASPHDPAAIARAIRELSTAAPASESNAGAFTRQASSRTLAGVLNQIFDSTTPEFVRSTAWDE